MTSGRVPKSVKTFLKGVLSEFMQAVRSGFNVYLVASAADRARYSNRVVRVLTGPFMDGRTEMKNLFEIAFTL
jgi:hypothetical protein